MQVDNVIEVRNLKKKYKLGAIGGHTLTEEIQSRIAKRMGKRDPNLPVWAVNGEDEFYAIDGIDLDIQEGDRLGIIGTNGAGKSTLLKILSRITTPTDGEIKIAGRVTSMLEVGTGFHGELTGRENIYLNGAILGMKKAEIDKKLDRIIDFSECERFIDTPVKRYSSGMYVKLGFAVASHLASDIMIMDEVLAVGDVNFQRKCLDKMSEIAESEGRTILYVSHNMSTIRRLCNKCIVLEKGKIVYSGNIEEAIQVYLKVPDEVTLHNDFTDREVVDEQFNKKIKVLSLDVLDRDTCQIEQGEKIKFRLTFQCNEDINNFCLRCIVSKLDDTRVGCAFSSMIRGGKVGSKIVYDCMLDTSSLAPGHFSLVIIPFRTDGSGNEEKFDLVTNAMVFDVVCTKGQFYNINWIRNSWGDTVYPELQVNEVSRNNE